MTVQCSIIAAWAGHEGQNARGKRGRRFLQAGVQETFLELFPVLLDGCIAGEGGCKLAAKRAGG
jgi:hypothetical protein